MGAATDRSTDRGHSERVWLVPALDRKPARVKEQSPTPGLERVLVGVILNERRGRDDSGVDEGLIEIPQG